MAVGPTNQTNVLYTLGDNCMLIGDIAERLGLKKQQVCEAAAKLIERGYVERQERGCFQLTASGHEAREKGETIRYGGGSDNRKPGRPLKMTVRQRAWNAMRIARTFAVSDIAMVIRQPYDGDVNGVLRSYFKVLEKAGYLVRHARRRFEASSKSGLYVYTLVRNTGSVAPVYSRVHRQIHDFNREASCSRN